ncbi:complement factor H-related protein 2-like [Discoglossus pictus]
MTTLCPLIFAVAYLGLYIGQGNTEHCGPAPRILNGKLKSKNQENFVFSLDYECYPNYVLSGSTNVICTNGQWSELPKCLRPCIISEKELFQKTIDLLSYDDYPGKILSHGTKIKIICMSGLPFLNQPALYGECNDGTMIYPQCLPDDDWRRR